MYKYTSELRADELGIDVFHDLKNVKLAEKSLKIGQF
jgi:hypothetical protein